MMARHNGFAGCRWQQRRAHRCQPRGCCWIEGGPKPIRRGMFWGRPLREGESWRAVDRGVMFGKAPRRRRRKCGLSTVVRDLIGLGTVAVLLIGGVAFDLLLRRLLTGASVPGRGEASSVLPPLALTRPMRAGPSPPVRVSQRAPRSVSGQGSRVVVNLGTAGCRAWRLSFGGGTNWRDGVAVQMVSSCPANAAPSSATDGTATNPLPRLSWSRRVRQTLLLLTTVARFG